MQPHEDETLESLASREGFGVVGAMAAAHLLSAKPETRARVRATVTRGFLPLAVGVLIGGLVGARVGGSLGWLIGCIVGLLVALRFTAPR
jgi:hypothetical protein